GKKKIVPELIEPKIKVVSTLPKLKVSPDIIIHTPKKGLESVIEELKGALNNLERYAEEKMSSLTKEEGELLASFKKLSSSAKQEVISYIQFKSQK
ncbi:MAG: hypothetical protein QME07_03055, partial [bacterium]|nr:hypothetical protein [bacterium]